MASAPSSSPPKFVPTLTDEVELPADDPLAQAQTVAAPVEVPGGYELPAGAPDDDEGDAAIAERPLNLDHVPELRTEVELVEDDDDLPSDIADEFTDQSTLPPAPPVAPDSSVDLQPVATPRAAPLPDGYEEYVVHRVMQRVDVMLEQRLREAIALVIQEQTRSIVPRLREEVESVVRQSVYEAVADELASTQPPPAGDREVD